MLTEKRMDIVRSLAKRNHNVISQAKYQEKLEEILYSTEDFLVMKDLGPEDKIILFERRYINRRYYPINKILSRARAHSYDETGHSSRGGSDYSYGRDLRETRALRDSLEENYALFAMSQLMESPEWDLIDNHNDENYSIILSPIEGFKNLVTARSLRNPLLDFGEIVVREPEHEDKIVKATEDVLAQYEERLIEYAKSHRTAHRDNV